MNIMEHFNYSSIIVSKSDAYGDNITTGISFLYKQVLQPKQSNIKVNNTNV